MLSETEFFEKLVKDDVGDCLSAVTFLEKKAAYLSDWLESFKGNEKIWFEADIQEIEDAVAIARMKVDQAKIVEKHAQECLASLKKRLESQSQGIAFYLASVKEGDNQPLDIELIQNSLTTKLKEIEEVFGKIKEKGKIFLDPEYDLGTGTGLESEVEIYKKSVGDDVGDYLDVLDHLEKKSFYLQGWLDSFKNKKLWGVDDKEQVNGIIEVIEGKVNQTKIAEKYAQKCLANLKKRLKRRNRSVASDAEVLGESFSILSMDPSGYLDDEDQKKWSKFKDSYKDKYQIYYEDDGVKEAEYEKADDFKKDMLSFQKAIKEKYGSSLDIESMKKKLATKTQEVKEKFSKIKEEVGPIIAPKFRLKT